MRALRHLAPVLLGCLAGVPAASAQTGAPTIQSVQTGCFYRLSRANNVLVKLSGVLAADYRFTFVLVGSQQTVLDRTLPRVNAGEEVPFQLPTAGTYRVTVRYITQAPGALPTTSAPFSVSAVMVAAVNGQPTCRMRPTAATPGPAQQ